MSFTFPEQVNGFVQITDNLAMQLITFSSATFARTTMTRSVSGSSITYIPSDEYESLASNADQCGIQHEGNNAQFDRIYSWTSPVSWVMKKLIINMAFGMNVSSYDTGNPNLESVDLDLRLDRQGVSLPLVGARPLRYSSGLSALSAAGTQIFIVSDAIYLNDALIQEGDILRITPTVNCNAGTGTTTRQEGLVNFFPYQSSICTRQFSMSGLGMDGFMIPRGEFYERILQERQDAQKGLYEGSQTQQPAKPTGPIYRPGNRGGEMEIVGVDYGQQ